MAGIIVDVSEDIQKLQQVKAEIIAVKQELKGIDVKVNLDIKENIETRLKSLMGQYDALVNKIAEAEGKITLSTQRINEASERIIQAQEKLLNATESISQSTGTQGFQSNSVETESIQAQAKAYDELREKIDNVLGYRMQNVQSMLKEQSEITRINTEIKEIIKSKGDYAKLTEEEKTKVEQLTDELQTHKAALAESRQALNNNVRIENAAATSMNALSQELERMKKAYRDLTEEERNSPFGKQLLASINQADSKIKELDATIGNHQRNVGNYGNSFNDLLGKVQSVPGPIGNVTTSIQSLTKASLTFIATPIGAVLAAISAALAVLSSWFNRTEEGQNALNVASAYFKQTLDSILDVVDDAGEWIWKAFTKPKEALTDLVDFLEGQVMNRLKAFGKMGEAIWKIFSGDFSEGFNDFGNACMQGVTGIEDAGKKASAFMDETNKKAQKRMEIAQKQNELDVKERKNIVERSKLEAKINELREKAYDERIPEKERAKAIKEASALTKKMYDDEIALAQERYEIVRDTNALSHSNKDAKMKEAQAEAAVNRLRASQAAAQRALLRQSNRFNNSNKLDTLRKNQEKYNLLLDKQALEQQRSAEDLQMKVDEARIKAMDEGSKKTIVQMELNFEKEMQAIDRQKEDALRKKIEDARAVWEADPKNKGKSFDATGIKLSDDESKYFDELYKVAIISFEKGKKELSDKQVQAWQEYFIEFGNYQEKRKNLIQKYDDEIAKLQSDSPEYAIKVAEKNQAVEQLDEQFGKSAKAMADLFEDASNKSVSAIQSIIDKYEMLIKYMSGSDRDITIGDLKDIGFTDKDIENIENGKISIKDITDAIKGLKDELKGKSPWLSFKSDIDKGVDAIKKAGGDSKKVGQGITDIGNAIVSFSPSIKQFGSDLASIFGEELNSDISNVIDGISGLGQTASGIGQIMSGDIVGGVMSAVSGISQVVNAMGSLFGSDGTAYYEKIKEQLEAINSVYDRIIDKSKENITFGGGFTSIDAASTALDNYEKKLLNLQKIADASGRAGASWNHHSAEWHSNKNVGSDNFAQMSEIIGKSIKSMDDLYYLSGDELYLLMSQMPEAWSAIDSRIRENLESIVDCKDEANELKDALNEAITGVSYDSFYSGFIDQLSNMETSYEDMCDNFEEYLRKSMMAGLVAGQYKDQIRKLYDSWVAAGSDQNYTKEEIQELRNARDELLQSMITERDNMAEIFGWESSSSTSQSSTPKGFQTMSQDTGEELNGRFTALQIAGEEIKNQNIKQTDLLSSINEKISLMDLTNENIPQLVANVPDFAGQTKEIATNSYQPQINVTFPDVKIDVLTAEVSTLKGIVDEMRTFQIEKFTDVAEGVIKISKNAPVMNNKLDSINNNIKKAL